MNEPKVGGAIGEAETEAWADTLAIMRADIDALCATPGTFGQAIVSSIREMFRIGFFLGYQRALDDIAKAKR